MKVTMGPFSTPMSTIFLVRDLERGQDSKAFGNADGFGDLGYNKRQHLSFRMCFVSRSACSILLLGFVFILAFTPDVVVSMQDHFTTWSTRFVCVNFTKNLRL